MWWKKNSPGVFAFSFSFVFVFSFFPFLPSFFVFPFVLIVFLPTHKHWYNKHEPFEERGLHIPCDASQYFAQNLSPHVTNKQASTLLSTPCTLCVWCWGWMEALPRLYMPCILYLWRPLNLQAGQHSSHTQLDTDLDTFIIIPCMCDTVVVKSLLYQKHITTRKTSQSIMVHTRQHPDEGQLEKLSEGGGGKVSLFEGSLSFSFFWDVDRERGFLDGCSLLMDAPWLIDRSISVLLNTFLVPCHSLIHSFLCSHSKQTTDWGSRWRSHGQEGQDWWCLRRS